jgi:hypothetical protein
MEIKGNLESPTLPGGPPPLDRVAETPVALELELVETSFIGKWFRRKWFAAAAASLTALAAVLTTLWLTTSAGQAPARTEAAESAVDESAVDESAVDESAVDESAVDESASAPQPTATEENPKKTKIAEEIAPADGVSDHPSVGLVTPIPDEAQPVVAPKTAAKQAVASQATEPAANHSSSPADEEDLAEPDLYGTTTIRPTGSGTTALRTIDQKTSSADLASTDPKAIKRLAPAVVDVAARLSDPVEGIELADMPLAKALDLLAALAALPITLDADMAAWRNIHPQDPVSVKLGPTTIGKILQSIADQKGLNVSIANHQVLITAPDDYREKLRTVPYTVADLTGNDKSALAELAGMVRKLVAPESWQEGNGRGTITLGDAALVVTQSGAVHGQVLVFCEKLRLARGKPLRSRGNPARFVLTTRRGQARKMLDQHVTANFHQPTPLGTVLAFLAEASGSDILIDRAALALAETSEGVEAALSAKDLPLGTALDELLPPLGLTYRVLDPRTLQVTSEEAAEERLELEFYPIEAGQAGAEPAFMAQIKAQAAPASWAEAGGAGEIVFDAASGCLLVLQSQPVQQAIERLLAKKH